ncbi:MAG: ATP synthase F0 subunit B [Candidatus Eremiobacteraeota bacterium]|nr:ATP synthase F0 subunit B [Candidatus Eremiobacteraeota bacterium]
MSEAQQYLQIALWSQVVSSIVFTAALIFMWFRWVMPVVMAAKERSNRQIADAERHRDEVKGALETLRGEIETARHDAQLIEQRAGLRAEHERDLLLNEAEEAGRRTLADAERELDRALTAARHRLRDEMLEAALAQARHDAMERVGPDLDARFVQRFTGSLEPATHG